MRQFCPDALHPGQGDFGHWNKGELVAPFSVSSNITTELWNSIPKSSSTSDWTTSFTDWEMTPFFGANFSRSCAVAWCYEPWISLARLTGVTFRFLLQSTSHWFKMTRSKAYLEHENILWLTENFQNFHFLLIDWQSTLLALCRKNKIQSWELLSTSDLSKDEKVALLGGGAYHSGFLLLPQKVLKVRSAACVYVRFSGVKISGADLWSGHCSCCGLFQRITRFTTLS